MEPSTSEMSYGPLITSRDASGKLAISTTSATARSSSSQSSRLNWQPSHEENFQTASFGLRFGTLDLRLAQQPGDMVQRKYGPVLADEDGTILAVAAKADAAFHVPFHRQEGVLRAHAALLQLHDGEAHHHFRATDEGCGI